jgi:hypothetical protein
MNTGIPFNDPVFRRDFHSRRRSARDITGDPATSEYLKIRSCDTSLKSLLMAEFYEHNSTLD